MARTQQNDVSQVVRNESDSAQDKRTHENVAEFGIPRDHGSQRLNRHFQHFAGFGDAAEDEAGLPRNHADLSRELAGSMSCDGKMASTSRLHDFHPARQHNEKRDIPIAGSEEYLSRLYLANLAHRPHTIDLGGR